MAGLRCTALQSRPIEFLDFTSVTLDEFQQLIPSFLKTYALQVVHGCLFGMVQGKANQWIHLLLPALLAALRALGDAPTRSLTALAQRLGVSETDAAPIVTPQAEAETSVAGAPADAPRAPLLDPQH